MNVETAKPEGHHGVHGRRIEAGNQPDQVHEQNKEENGAEKGQVFGTFVADHFFRGGMDEFVNEFERVLNFAGAIYRKAAAGESEEYENEQHDQDLADHPVAPGIAGILRREMDGVQQCIGGTGEGAVEEAGDPEFVWHLVACVHFRRTP